MVVSVKAPLTTIPCATDGGATGPAAWIPAAEAGVTAAAAETGAAVVAAEIGAAAAAMGVVGKGVRAFGP